MLHGSLATIALSEAKANLREPDKASTRVQPDECGRKKRIQFPRVAATGSGHVIYIIKENPAPTIRSSAIWAQATAILR